MPDIDIDIVDRGPLRVGIDDGHKMWLTSPGEFVRIRGVNLRQVARQAVSIRAERPGVDILVDINVIVADDAQNALAQTNGLPETGTLLYAGTPGGLAGLIADLHALAITDGAMLIPAVDHTHAGLLRERLLTELHSLAPAAFPHARPA